MLLFGVVAHWPFMAGLQSMDQFGSTCTHGWGPLLLLMDLTEHPAAGNFFHDGGPIAPYCQIHSHHALTSLDVSGSFWDFQGPVAGVHIPTGLTLGPSAAQQDDHAHCDHDDKVRGQGLHQISLTGPPLTDPLRPL